MHHLPRADGGDVFRHLQEPVCLRAGPDLAAVLHTGDWVGALTASCNGSNSSGQLLLFYPFNLAIFKDDE